MDAATREYLRAEIDREARHRTRETVIGLQHNIEPSWDLLVALGNLDDNQREAWVDRNMLGRTLRAIGCDMSIHPLEVRRLEHEAQMQIDLALAPILSQAA